MNQNKYSCILSTLVIFMLLVGCTAPTSTIPTQEVSTVMPTPTITPSPVPTHTSTPLPTATHVPTYTPTPTIVPLTSTAIAAGGYHTCAVTDRGGVMCWGDNRYGQLGDGTTTTRQTPVDVVGLTSGVLAVAAGSWHTCAVMTAGGAKCWGDNWGKLGDGTTEQRPTPVDVVGLTSGVVSVAVGENHTCALTIPGGVKCWGDNSWGQLGDWTKEQRLTPVEVVGLSTGVLAISSGGIHSCALMASGGVKCWGNNDSGQLGDGTKTDRYNPVDVVGLTSGVKAIQTGAYHTCALTKTGGVWCWGSNALSVWSDESGLHIGEGGQLGDGTTEGRLTPVQVLGLTISATAISAGWSHNCALTITGGVKCWGDNADGQLGDGTIERRLMAVQVEGLTSGVASIDVGVDHSCAIMASGGVRCWGANLYGQLGDGSGEEWLVPGEVVGLTGGVTAIDAGESHTCALTTGWGGMCWGSGRDGDNTSMLTPVDLEGFTSEVKAISSGMYHTCVLTAGGGVKCWGFNWYGLLGDGTKEDRSLPVDVVGLTSGVQAISAGMQHTCALMASGGVKCWGGNWSGQLGDGTTKDRSTPVDVVGLTSSVSAISSGANHICALLTNGGVKCWGRNWSGQLGDGTKVDRSTPVDVVGLTSGVQAISAGTQHTCAVLEGGGVKCWGNNWAGQLGDGTTEQRLTSVDVMGLTSDVLTIDASNAFYGGRHTCALMESGGVKCWGANEHGQLGDGTTEQRLTPVDVAGLTSDVLAVAAGADHTCALTTGGGVMCWGSNHHGALGRGTAAIQTMPVDVVGFGP